MPPEDENTAVATTKPKPREKIRGCDFFEDLEEGSFILGDDEWEKLDGVYAKRGDTWFHYNARYKTLTEH